MEETRQLAVVRENMNQSIKTVISTIALGLLLSGCISNSEKYQSIDQSQKTITVPPGSAGLKGSLKKQLQLKGWDMQVYGGPQITEGSIGANTKLRSYSSFNTRYRLLVVSRQYDICLNLQPAINYEIILLDNKTGKEVLTMDGQGCENAVVKKFESELEN